MTGAAELPFIRTASDQCFKTAMLTSVDKEKCETHFFARENLCSIQANLSSIIRPALHLSEK
jgi:hypothetical protein